MSSSVFLRHIFVYLRPPLPQVESLCFPQQQGEPVDLWSQQHQVPHVTVQRQVEGHLVQRNAELPAVHPVHEGEYEDATCEEGQ